MLSGLNAKNIQARKWQGINIWNHIRQLSHMLYANDVAIFGQATHQNVEYML